MTNPDLAALSEVEPVAWLVRHEMHGTEVTTLKCTEADKAYGWTETPLYTHPAPPADLVELVTILHQYRSDMLRPPAPDSRERRVAMIDAAIAKFGRDA